MNYNSEGSLQSNGGCLHSRSNEINRSEWKFWPVFLYGKSDIWGRVPRGGKIEQTCLVFDRALVKTAHGDSLGIAPGWWWIAEIHQNGVPFFLQGKCPVKSKLSQFIGMLSFSNLE